VLHKLRLGSPGIPDELHREVHTRIRKLESPIAKVSKSGCKDR
jgi:hypothetical protein